MWRVSGYDWQSHVSLTMLFSYFCSPRSRYMFSHRTLLLIIWQPVKSKLINLFYYDKGKWWRRSSFRPDRPCHTVDIHIQPICESTWWRKALSEKREQTFSLFCWVGRRSENKACFTEKKNYRPILLLWILWKRWEFTHSLLLLFSLNKVLRRVWTFLWWKLG